MPYVKLLTQMVDEHMVVANGSSCLKFVEVPQVHVQEVVRHVPKMEIEEGARHAPSC